MWLDACAAADAAPSDDRLQSAQALDVPPTLLAQLQQRMADQQAQQAQQAPAAFALWPDSWLPLQLFIAMGTQWTDHGLRLEALPLAARSAGIRQRAALNPQVLADLRVMERAALQWRAQQRNTTTVH